MFIFNTGLSDGEVPQDEVIQYGVSVMKQAWGDSCWFGGHAVVVWTSALVGLGNCAHGCNAI